jgi:hypothetical protein
MTLMVLFLAACAGATPAPQATEPPAAPTAVPALALTVEPTTAPTAVPAATEPPAAPTTTPALVPTSKPTTTPTAAPVTRATCLVGTWRATNLIELAAAMFVGRGQAVPPDLAISGGKLTVVFGPEGQGTYTYDNLTLEATIDAGGMTLPMRVIVNGQGSAAYNVVDAAEITFSEIKAEDLRVETTIGSAPAPMVAPEEAFVVMEEEAATYSCKGNVAELVFPERVAAPLILERVP